MQDRRAATDFQPQAESRPDPGSLQVVDYDLHGMVGIRLVDASAADTAAVDRQLGPIQRPLERPPDVTIRFVDRLRLSGRTRLLGLDEAAFTDDAFLVLRSKHKTRARVQIPMAQVGNTCEIVCERGMAAVPFLIPIVNLTALGNGALPLHAAAFNTGGTGVLVTGWSKGGKTETLLAFMARGARYIGDEWVYIDALGERMGGIPEPIRVWDWHLQQLRHLHAAVSRADRSRLLALRGVLGLEAALSRAPGRNLRPARLLRRARPLLQRQACVDLHPQRLFGDRLDLSGNLDRVVFAASQERTDIVARSIDPREIAARMVFSLQYERLPFLGVYHAFRFAFPAGRNALVETAEELQRERLQRLFASKPCFTLEHPYPVSIPALHDTLEPLL